MMTLADLKAALGVTGTTDDAFLQSQLDYYTAVVQLYTRRQLVQASYTDAFYRPGTDTLQLSEFPVQSITSVTVDGVAETASAWQAEMRTGRLHRGTNGLGSFASARRVECVYTAGYSPMPADLQLVIVSLVRGAYANQSAGGATAASTSAGGGDVKSVTAFGVMKVDYDTTTSSGTVLGIERKKDANIESVLGNHVGILMRYRDDAKTLATASG